MAARPNSKTTDVRPERRTVTDPRAIRALAHPARLAVLDALSLENAELTATECAKLAGVSPSAMSYHLRALEKWGFVERVESSGDGRERPWRAVSRTWGIDSLPDPATVSATEAVTNIVFNRAAAELGEWFRAEADQPKEWREFSGVDSAKVWLTAEELAELSETHRAYLDARRDRTAKRHPAGARRVRVLRVSVPERTD